MKIYTKTGDKGTTELIGGARVPKNNLQIVASGTIDELNAYLGLIRDKIDNIDDKEKILIIQNDLFRIATILATDTKVSKFAVSTNFENNIEFLEKEIDAINETLRPLTKFIIPGGQEAVSFCNISRTISRRAERKVVELSQRSKVKNDIIVYLNRLSDYLFTFSRKLSKDFGVEEIEWRSDL